MRRSLEDTVEVELANRTGKSFPLTQGQTVATVLLRVVSSASV